MRPEVWAAEAARSRLAGEDDPEVRADLLGVVLESEGRGDDLRAAVALIGRLEGDVVARLAYSLMSLDDAMLGPHLDELLRNPDARVAASIIDSLGARDNAERRAKMRALLRMRSGTLKRIAVTALRNFPRSDWKRDILIDLVRREPHDEVRFLAGLELAKFSGPEVGRAFLDALAVYPVTGLGFGHLLVTGRPADLANWSLREDEKSAELLPGLELVVAPDLERPWGRRMRRLLISVLRDPALREGGDVIRVRDAEGRLMVEKRHLEQTAMYYADLPLQGPGAGRPPFCISVESERRAKGEVFGKIYATLIPFLEPVEHWPSELSSAEDVGILSRFGPGWDCDLDHPDRVFLIAEQAVMRMKSPESAPRSLEVVLVGAARACELEIVLNGVSLVTPGPAGARGEQDHDHGPAGGSGRSQSTRPRVSRAAIRRSCRYRRPAGDGSRPEEGALAMTMSIRALSVLLLLVFLGPLAGQDRLELADGRKLRGEILSEKDGRLRFVTRDAELVEVALSEVVERKEGSKLSAKIRERLGDQGEDLERLLETARWAAEEKSLARDAERLWRRILALDPDEDEARRALGQIRLGGVWYADEKEGLGAWGKILAEEGYVRAKEGFIKKNALAAFRRDPRAFALDEERRWRPVEELMRERGMRLWQGEWYHAIDEGLLLSELEALDEALGIKAQAYRHRGNEIFVVGARFQAEKLAKKLTDARSWVLRNLAVTEKSFLDERAQFFCLADRAQYRAFLERYGKKHGRDADKVRFCLDLTGMSFGKLNRVTDQEQTAWDNSLVSGLAAALARYEAPEGFEVPAAFWVAAAMRAEEAVMGAIEVHFVAQSRYDRASGPVKGFADVAEARRDLAEMRIRRQTRPLTELLTVDLNGLLPAHELQGYFFLGFLLETRREAFLAFWKGEARGDERAEARFQRCFGSGVAEVEEAFWAWFERLPR